LLDQKEFNCTWSGFGEKYGTGHFRLVYLPSIEILDSAMNKIEEFVTQ